MGGIWLECWEKSKLIEQNYIIIKKKNFSEVPSVNTEIMVTT